MNTLAQLKRGDCDGATRLALAEGLTSFPKEIYTLADTLEVLDLSNNQLTHLLDDLYKLHKLKIIFASCNRFTVLPPVLGQCCNLEMIGFKSNAISEVPSAALPPSLKWLILTDNAITQLPKAIGTLQQLKKLMLAGNRLTALPDEIAHCLNLQLLRVSANALTAFPRVVCHYLSWLGWRLRATPLSHFCLSIVKGQCLKY